MRPPFAPGLLLLLLTSCTMTGSRDSASGTTESAVESNRAIARRFFAEVWSGGSEAVAEELLAPTYVGHLAGNPEPLDRAGWFAFYRAFRQAFPDARFTVEDAIAEGDQVVLRLTMRGTHQGVFNGIPATGRAVTVSGVSIERIVEGRIVEGWVTSDALGMLQQLGALPPPPAP